MSDEDMAGAGAEAAVSYGLSDVAENIEMGPVPYDRLMAGGRRRLRRRRLLTGGAAAVLVVAVAGAGTAIGGYGREAGGASVVAASSTAAIASVTPTAVATPTATPTASAAPAGAARDPFTPFRVKVGEGTANGHTWQAWTALWPSATTKEDARKQAQLITAERQAADPKVRPVAQEDVDRNWSPLSDEVNMYVTVDGKRQADDALSVISSPAGKDGKHGFVVSGASLGLDGKDMGVPPVVIYGVLPEVAKVAVTWETGGTTEAVPVTVGDSPFRWYAVGAKPGSNAKSVSNYAADGSVLSTNVHWLRTN
ncbi:hypothetical protein ACIRYZ_29860 [Kitasatospora sp. NPDC101155]|uniref:hypothetical protein n=1 Tax=Kitasatospora sp. NPDC101155 TaxID=3364097 RepID=UPI0037F19FC6